MAGGAPSLNASVYLCQSVVISGAGERGETTPGDRRPASESVTCDAGLRQGVTIPV